MAKKKTTRAQTSTVAEADNKPLQDERSCPHGLGVDCPHCDSPAETVDDSPAETVDDSPRGLLACRPGEHDWAYRTPDWSKCRLCGDQQLTKYRD